MKNNLMFLQLANGNQLVLNTNKIYMMKKVGCSIYVLYIDGTQGTYSCDEGFDLTDVFDLSNKKIENEKLKNKIYDAINYINENRKDILDGGKSLLEILKK